MRRVCRHGVPHQFMPILRRSLKRTTSEKLGTAYRRKAPNSINGTAILPAVSQYYGGVAQLGEHLPCKQGVRSSILLISTILVIFLPILHVFVRLRTNVRGVHSNAQPEQKSNQNTRLQEARSGATFAAKPQSVANVYGAKSRPRTHFSRSENMCCSDGSTKCCGDVYRHGVPHHSKMFQTGRRGRRPLRKTVKVFHKRDVEVNNT